MVLDSSVPSIALGALFVAWLLATVVNSTIRGYRKLGGRWFTHLIPRWNFFAPRPGTRDFYLVYRDEFATGGVGAWQEVPGFYEDRGPSQAVWNPAKFHEKALYDLAQELLTTGTATATSEERTDPFDRPDAGDADFDPIKLTTAYIALLNYVAERPRSGLSVATQFAILRGDGPDGAIDPVFLSGFHEL